MSFWVELHCDANISKECVNFDHNYPMQHARNASSISLTAKRLAKVARERGWKFCGRKWHCRECAKAAAPEPKEGV